MVRRQEMTVPEAARRLGVSKARIYRLIEKGRIRVEEREEQGRARGRFSGGRSVLNREDVQREAEERGR
jgi:predicted site-specific integrase-resolvase